jgi:MFS family permease
MANHHEIDDTSGVLDGQHQMVTNPKIDHRPDDGDNEQSMLRSHPVTQGAGLIHRLGLEALDPSFQLLPFLRSAGLNDQHIHTRMLALQSRFESPFAWTLRKKIITLGGPFLAATLAAYSAGAYALGSQPLRQRWNINETEYAIGITVFVSGFGFAPIVMAPLSEAYGRYWVFVGAGIVFLLGTTGCAVTDSYGGMMASRLVTGMGASIFATLTGGVVGDIFHKEDRNTPMTLYSLAIMLGTGLGPLSSGIIVDHLGWQWIFYLQMIMIAITNLIIMLLFQETRGNVVLAKKCIALNKLADEYGLRADGEPVRFEPQTIERKLNLGFIYRSFTFPLRLLVSEPVVLCFSLWASFAWAILYMQFNSIGIVFRAVYGFTSVQVGAVYTVVVLASVLGSVIAIVQDIVTRRLWPRRMATPEGRLLSPGVQSVLLPIGLFWFGWASRPETHWMSPVLAIGACTVGIFSIYLAVFNYLADTYGRYASSAQAAQSMCRNLLAGIFPLFTHIMLTKLTYHGTGSLLGGIGLMLTVIPWLLAFFGHRMRAKGPLAKAVMET